MEGNPFAGGLWGDLGDWLASVAWVLPVVGVVVVVVVVVVFAVGFVARGGGQYGIIEGYVGTIGAGKTTLAVQHALELARARNALLLSNIPVVCGKLCKEGVHRHEHELLPVNDDGLDLGALMRRAFELRDQGRGLVLLLDEVGVIMPARLWKQFPVGLMWTLQQSRKLACEWVWTAQDVTFVDLQLRTLTAVVHYVRAYPPPSIWRRARGKRPWLMIASAFAPKPNAHERVEKRIARRVFRYRRAWEATFDTDGVVLPSKHLQGAGVLLDAVLASGLNVQGAGSTWGESERVVEVNSESANESANGDGDRDWREAFADAE